MLRSLEVMLSGLTSARPARPLLAALPAALLLALAPGAGADQSPVPVPGTVLSGAIDFPRDQGMTLSVDAHDPSRATAAIGFDGRCKGSGIGEFWAKYIPARETVRIRHGRFSASLTGVTRNVGGIPGRTGVFKWKLSGRFSGATTATATVSGNAKLRAHGHLISRCRIAHRARVKLTPGVD
jgi:hypothetical protein